MQYRSVIVERPGTQCTNGTCKVKSASFRMPETENNVPVNTSLFLTQGDTKLVDSGSHGFVNKKKTKKKKHMLSHFYSLLQHCFCSTNPGWLSGYSHRRSQIPGWFLRYSHARRSIPGWLLFIISRLGFILDMNVCIALLRAYHSQGIVTTPFRVTSGSEPSNTI